MGLAIILVYSAVLLGIGYLCMRRVRSVGDFFLGGRQIGPWVSAFAYGTTYFSAVLFIGFAGKVGWAFGLDSLWVVAGNTLVGTLLAWKLLARRTRAITSRLGTMTMPQFLGARFQSQFLVVVSAIIIFFFLVPYSASVFIGLSYLFEVTFAIPYEQVAILMCLVTAAFLVMGGYRAIAITDVLMGTLMLAGALPLFISIASAAGGLTTVIKEVPIRYAQNVPVQPGFLGILPIVLLTSLGPLALPQMVQKFYAIKNEKVIFTALIVSTVFAFVVSFCAYASGALSHMFFYVLPEGNPDLLMPTLISRTVSPLLVNLVVLLVLAASMSTLSSLVLVSASSLAMDLFAGVMRPQAPREQTMVLMRVLCGLFIALSLVIALHRPTIIVYLMSISWGTVAGAFLAPYLYGLYWRGTTRVGAIAGLLSGLIFSVGLYVVLGQARSTEAGVTAMLLPLLVVPLVSILTKPLPERHLDRVFGDAQGRPTAIAAETASG